ncbi:MAG: TetR/AcrR family transcriptional regulator [Nocardioidaceae bacterium]|nr:TetR/AcrR family transcriptional regulator [Nocardioidaceae bacterium]MCL2612789.1 TetR/AcrR family transcriptional regulator [Nocardioidaceae bacterium]
MTGEQLPRGRHDFTAEQVRENQRIRLLVAMAEACSADGYQETTVAAVIRRAGISRKTFYELFSDKEDCFVQAYDLGSAVLMDAIAQARAREGSWEERLERGFVALTDAIADNHAFAEICILHVWSAGSRARVRHYETTRRFAVFLQDVGEELGSVALGGIVGGISSILLRHLAEGSIDSVRDLVPDLVDMVLLPLEGHRARK